MSDKQQQENAALYTEVKKYREENEALQKQKTFLQRQCKKAGIAIYNQEQTIAGLKRDIDRLSEENNNLKIMFKGKDE